MRFLPPRLIKAGGGEVLSAMAPFSGNTGATHLLTEARYTAGCQIDFAALANHGVPVLKPLYLNDFLTSLDKPPALDEFMIDDYKAHWDSKKRSRMTTDTPTNPVKKSKSVFGNV